MLSRFTIIWALLIFCQLGVSSSAGSAEDEGERLFVAGNTDIPVMPGLVENQDARVIFDKTDGRIVEARLMASAYASDETVDNATRFYRESLSQLGWILAGGSASEAIFCREGERLKIRFVIAEGRLVVDFSLSPATLPGACGS